MAKEYCYIPQPDKDQDGKTVYKDALGNGVDIAALDNTEFTQKFIVVVTTGG